MSEKARFIRSIVARSLPGLDKLDACIAYGEQVWDVLTARGYGGPKAEEPKARASVDWRARLDPIQQAVFDIFWAEYNKVGKEHRSGGKNEAAKRWHEIDPPGPLADRIVAAAKADAKKWRESPPAALVRMYAQGWLTARRWEDYEPEAATGNGGAGADPRAAAALADLRHWERLAQARPNDATIAAHVREAQIKWDECRGR